MAEKIILKPSEMKKIRDIDDRLVSWNVEMTEVTGGTFWKAYTPEQIAGEEEFTFSGDFGQDSGLYQYYDPIDTKDEKLLKLTKNLGPTWTRVSGTWANKTYYDLDEKLKPGEIPEGFQAVLTKKQWENLLDFVKETDGKLLISVANCPGIHAHDEPFPLDQAKMILDFSKEYGVPVDAVEFTNEPNMAVISGLPEGYTPEDYARDQDIFFKFVKENYPETLVVGPCSVGDSVMGDRPSGGVESVLANGLMTTDMLMKDTKVPVDVFSYHYYNGGSERIAGMAPGAHWDASKATTEAYLDVAPIAVKTYGALRDKYAPGRAMWVTESGDAGGGGNTWASTYMDVIRTLNELGMFGTMTDGIIFHNTLASSDYGYLSPEEFDPRPNYFAVLLWNMLMGQEVYDTEEAIREGAHVFAHNRKDGKPGKAYLVINNSPDEVTEIEFAGPKELYRLSADNLRSTVMKLNGRDLVLDENNDLPDLSPEIVEEETIQLQPNEIAFVLTNE